MKCLFDESHDYEVGHCCEAERRAHIEHLEAALQAAFSLLREKDRQLQKAQHDRDRLRARSLTWEHVIVLEHAQEALEEAGYGMTAGNLGDIISLLTKKD